MSVSPLATDPSPFPLFFQLATPFEYVISNSAPYYPLISAPTYTTGLSNAASNTSPYSPNDTLLYTTGLPNSNITSSGIAYTSSNLSVGSIFEFTLPYPSTGMAGTGSMYFLAAAQATFSNVGHNVRIGGGPYYSYSSGDSVRYIYNGANSFTAYLVLGGDATEFGSYTTTVIQFVMNGVTWPSSPYPVSIEVKAPDHFDRSKATYPYLVTGSLTTPELLPMISGSGTTEMTFASTGFESVLSLPVLQIVQVVDGVTVGSTEFPFDIIPINITVTPSFPVPFNLVTYQPFTYNFSLPSGVENIVLRPNSNTSPSLLPYISEDGSFFASDVGLAAGGQTTLQMDAVLNGSNIVTYVTTDIFTDVSGITILPAIPSGSLNLYKYEPFSYVCTTNPLSPNLTLQFTNSSSELQAFCSISDDQKSVTFAGTFAVSYSVTLSLKVDLLLSGSIVGTTTILVAVGPGRFFPPAPNQNYQLYQYEDISNTFGSNPVFSTVLAIDSIVTVPGLPPGVSLAGTSNTFYLQGTPALQAAQSNYQVIGSNSSNGKIVTVNISIKVNAQLVRITPSTEILTGLTVDSAISPITFTAIQPQTYYGTTFTYTSTGLPDGFTFFFPDGNNISQTGTPKNDVVVILEGAPSLAFANSMAASGSNLYQTRLYGTQFIPGGKQVTGSALINFSFAETVLINVSNSVTLYQTKPLGSNDVVINAGSYFSSSTISNITANSLPPGLSLVSYMGSSNYHLVGTPTDVNLSGSYTFTATNYNGNSRSTTITLPILPDIVVFGGATPSNGTLFRFIVSRPLLTDYETAITFTATSTANATPITYSSPTNFIEYGLIFNTSTGTLTGTPTSPFATDVVLITARDHLGTVGTTTIQLEIIPDVFTWPTYTPTYIQNQAIDPFQFVMVSTSSGRTIQSYSSTDLPSGFVLNPSGRLSGITSAFPTGGTGTFHIIATTGYSTLTQEYTYTMIADTSLTIQVNTPASFSGLQISNIYYKTIQYSINELVNPVYTITNIYPPQSSPLPIWNFSPEGVMSGDFTNGLVQSYTAFLNATYNNATGSTPIVLNFSKPLTSPILLASYHTRGGDLRSENYFFGGYLATTKTYVFPEKQPQAWSNNIPVTLNLSSEDFTRIAHPDIARIGDNYVSAGSSAFYFGAPQLWSVQNGVYNYTTSNIDWEIDGRFNSGANFGGVANDGINVWVMVERSRNGGPNLVWQRTGFSGAQWTPVAYTVDSLPTIAYISPNFVIGNDGSSVPIQYGWIGNLSTWSNAITQPAFSNVFRLTTSNTTIVAVGSGAGNGVFPLAYSIDSASNWVTVTTNVARLKGSNVTINDIMFANNEWVMCGLDSNSSGFIAYSANLSNWTIYANSNIPVTEWTALTFNGNAWTFTGSYIQQSNGYHTGSIVLSLDAGTWGTQTYQISSNTLFNVYNELYPLHMRTHKLLSSTHVLSNSNSGTIYIPNTGALPFILPSTQNFNLFQYVPYSIPLQASGTSEFIYYYIIGTPLGFSLLQDNIGVSASITGIPSTTGNSTITIYATTKSGLISSITLTLNTVIPFFVNPQSGAGAYTALLRNEVEANAAQNARDQRVFPQVDPLAGPYMGPRAPDVVTPDDCQLKLCKKPCPTCHS